MPITSLGKQNSKTIYGGSWTNLENTDPSPATTSGTGSNISQTLESSINTNGVGLFGATGGTLATDGYTSLTYTYDKRLDATTGTDPDDGAVDIYDDSASGALAGSKYIRVVENTKNVTDATGLNLKVYAKNLSTEQSPPSDRIYVDPALGKFVMPRPVYWSKCESRLNITTTPEIGVSMSHSYYGTGDTYSSDPIEGKFNKGVYVVDSAVGRSSGVYFTYPQILTKGTLSCWLRLGHYSTNDVSAFNVFLKSDESIHASAEVQGGVYAGRLNISGVTGGTISDSTWHSLHIVWDQAKSLSGGKSIRIFVDEVEQHSSTATYIFDILKIRIATYVGSTASRTSVDNIKIWDSCIETPFEYNLGTGREDALHPIYGATNGYKPVTSGVNNGVGYYRSGASNNKAVIRLRNS